MVLIKESLSELKYNKKKCKPSDTERELRLLLIIEAIFISMAFILVYKAIGLTALIVFIVAEIFYVIFSLSQSEPGLKVAAKISNVVLPSVWFLLIGVGCILQWFKLVRVMGLIFALAGLMILMVHAIVTIYSSRKQQ